MTKPTFDGRGNPNGRKPAQGRFHGQITFLACAGCAKLKSLPIFCDSADWADVWRARHLLAKFVTYWQNLSLKGKIRHFLAKFGTCWNKIQERQPAIQKIPLSTPLLGASYCIFQHCGAYFMRQKRLGPKKHLFLFRKSRGNTLNPLI